MKICFASDLHTEMNNKKDFNSLAIAEKPDVVIFAGDIAIGSDNFIKYLKKFYIKLSKKRPTKIIAVSGNHEYYDGCPMEKFDSEVRDAFSNNKNIFYLQNDFTVINDVLFVGGTLWTDFEINGKEDKFQEANIISHTLNDFRFINHKESRHGSEVCRFSTAKWMQCHEETRNFISQVIEKNQGDLPVVVVTHHGGIEQANGSSPFKQDLKAGFVSDCSDIYNARNSGIVYWVSGHVHESLVYKEPKSGVTFGVNCYGYERYEEKLTKNFKWRSFEV